MADGGPLASRLGRRPVATLLLVARLLRDDPWWTVVKLLSVLPGRVRAVVGRLLAPVAARLRLRGPSALAAWAVGGTAAARELLAARAAEGPLAPGEAALAVEVDLPELLLAQLDDDATPGPVVGRAALRALRRAGRYAELDDRAERWGLADDPRVQRLREDVAQRRALLGEPALAPPRRSPPAAGDARTVLHLLNNSMPHHLTGYTRRSHAVLRAQAAAGLRPVAATKIGFPLSHGVPGVPDRERHDGVDYRRLADPEPANQLPLDRLGRQVEALGDVLVDVRPGVLHTTTPNDNGTCVEALARWAGLPWVYEVRGLLEETWRSRRGEGAEHSELYVGSRRREAAVARAADAVVTLGHAMADDLVARGVPADAITVVPNAVDPDRLRPRGDGPALRARLGLPPSAWVLGYVSSLVDYEGVEVLLDAVALLREAGHDARCLVVGDGAARPSLEAHAARLDAGGWATFTGRVAPDEVGAAYEAIDLFVVPRLPHRVCQLVTPLKPVEALAMQRPLLMSDLPALRELEEAGTAAYFAAGDPAALASAALDHAPDAAALAAGRRWVVGHRTWSAMGMRYAELYARLTSSR